ncbi:MAG: hypothetical protein ACI9F9_003291, partial [Candidatus Paceibacteria bacterium]
MRFQLYSGLLTLLVTTLSPQSALSISESNEADASIHPLTAMAEWQAIHGHNWRAESRAGGYVEMLWGGMAESEFVPLTDQDRFNAASAFIEAAQGIHGVEPKSLQPMRVDFIPLGQIGSTDKWNAKFVQAIDGVRVTDAYVNVLLDDSGNL